MTGLALFAVATLNAQVDDDWLKQMKESQKVAQKEYEEFQQQAIKQYDDFRRKANEDYAKFMEEAWKAYDAQPAEEPPTRPKPPVPLIDEKDPEPAPTPDPGNEKRPDVEPVRIPDPIILPELTRPYVAPERPQPIQPIVPNTVPMTAAQNVILYGSPFPFHIENEPMLALKDVSEKSVAKMWKELSEPSFDHIIAECLQQRDQHNLCDWAYIRLTQSVAERQFGKGTNEAVVMQMYLLTQSGYQMRIGRDNSNKHLVLLIGSDELIYRYKCFILGGKRFYIMDKRFKQRGLDIFDHAFPNEKTFSLALTQPDLQVVKTKERTITSDRFDNVSVTVQTNQNLIDFYNDYPLSAMWHYYSLASLSEVMKESLYPALRKAIEGKTELMAANILLNFVQTGFKYQKDDQQFGYERPLYPDESFYYPYCDCEDRSILFSCLVRELLGLDVVLLDYPGHIATAVCFNEDVKGDYFELDGKKFVISDPTYINAPVGECAPKYRDKSPKLIKF